MAMARVTFLSAICVAFSIRQREEANRSSWWPEDDMDDMDDMDEEMRTSKPVTPRLDLHDPRLEDVQDDLKNLDSSMEMAEPTDETETCGTGKPTYEITGKLGQGNWGTVYKVRTLKDEKSQYFALKVPLQGDKDAAAANVKEMNIMGKVDWQCTHVLPLVEKAPCVAEWGPMTTSFVTKLLPGDLETWSEHASKSEKVKCIGRIFDGISSGLECLHMAGYVHGDIKPDNILYNGLDEDGCPKDIMLSDFGLTLKVGDPNAKFEHKWWKLSFHIPETMFEGVHDMYDPLRLTFSKISTGIELVHMDPVLDWCSLAFVLRHLVPNSDSKDLEKVEKLRKKVTSSERLRGYAGKGRCGEMGPGRKWSLP